MNGVLLVNKTAGITSHDVVSVVRRIFKMKSVGHAGTLDPFATGLLILLLGEATKLSDYLRDGDKTYRTKIKLGIETDTLDLTGQVLSETQVKVTPQEIEKAILEAEGDLELPVPHFSAVKVNGEKLYNKARKGETFQTPQKQMSFYEVHVEEIFSEGFQARLSCKKGGYIRSWGELIGKKLQCGAHLVELNRLASSGFSVQDAIDLESLQNIQWDEDTQSPNQKALGASYVPMSECLKGWPTIMTKGKDEILLMNGQISYDIRRRLIVEQREAQNTGESIGIRVLSAQSGQLLALLEARPQSILKIKRTFRY